jgi:isopentenyl-diphosphate delta-isomerase
MEKQTESRKKEHVDFVLEKGAQYSKTTGLERFEFLHNAIPEVDYSKIDLSCSFLGKRLSYPLMITAMTGGYADAKEINRTLAKCAEKHGWALGLGSQRAMVEDAKLRETYYVRDVAPNTLIIGNIGAFQLKRYPIERIEKMLDDIDANALAIHLNPLQEIIQPEGDRDFSGILQAIKKACEEIDVPIIVKETGAGISTEVALKLKDAGVSAIDIAGAGGTSWSKVEYLRKGAETSASGFEEWGIPTADSILMCKGILPLVASGGIRNGIEAAKTIALGANISGAAYPFLLELERNGKTGLDALLTKWEEQLKTCAFLTGSNDYDSLRAAKLTVR